MTGSPETVEIRASTVLPATRENVEFTTTDGVTLVGELAVPEGRSPVATLVTLHPLPTAGGFMDSHVLRKVAARLPAMADVAVLRFNTRGTSSPRGRSGGDFGDGIAERADVAAAMDFVTERGLPHPWLVGWSFGTELALKYGREHPIDGAILLSPPLHRASADDVAGWAGDRRRLIAIIPELDDFLRPDAAAERFASVPDIELVAVEGGKHLWVGETQTHRVLTEIVARVSPAALPLLGTWSPPSD